MRRRWIALAAVLTAAAFVSGWYLQGALSATGDANQTARLFEAVLRRVRDHHVDSLPENELYVRAARGLVGELRDPYAALLIGRDYQRLQERVTGDYVGVGLLVDRRDDALTVISPIPGSPAERAGLRTGDQILEIDGVAAAQWGADRAVPALRGPRGTSVKLLVRRDDEPPFTVAVARDRIHRESVSPPVLLEGGVGYVSMTPVSDRSAAELEQRVTRLRSQGMTSLILDLRSNPGGPRDEAVRAADLFLDPGAEILSSRGRGYGDNNKWLDRAPQRWRDLPVVVLVNEGTASAAEIIAGALQDHDRAVVVGQPSYGKGVVQTLYPLGSDVALRITTAEWFTPSGRSIHRYDRDSLVAPAAGTTADTAGRPKFRSEKGRALLGGGGIVPDVILPADTLLDSEREFARDIGDDVPAFRGALAAIARELRRTGKVTSPDFVVTDSLRDAVLAGLRERGASISNEAFAGGARIVDRQLGIEAVRHSLGREGETRRRVLLDAEVSYAAELLRRSPTPAALLTRAAEAARALGDASAGDKGAG